MARSKPHRTLSQRAGRLFRRLSSSSSRSVEFAGKKETVVADDASANGSVASSPQDIASLPSPSPSPLSSQTSLASDESRGMCPPEAPASTPAPVTHHQGQSNFFRRLPPEIREQIYVEYWRIAGVDRHVFLQDSEFCFAPCITDHDDPVDECQTSLAAEFGASPCVQQHEKWFKRMTSTWCNHWRCEEAYRKTAQRQKKDPTQAEHDWEKPMTCPPLLLSCKRFYHEALPSMNRQASLTITDSETAHALLIRRKRSRRGGEHPVFAFLPHVRTINIALREGGPDFLHLHGPALWRALSAPSLRNLQRVSLWLDGWEPVSRRLIPQHRALWDNIPPALAARLTVSLPCGPDGLWAWDAVRCRVAGPYVPAAAEHDDLADNVVVEILPKLKPLFRVVLRGWEAYTATGHGWIMRNKTAGRGGPGPRRLMSNSNPFEDLKLYGRGYFDPDYP